MFITYPHARNLSAWITASAEAFGLEIMRRPYSNGEQRNFDFGVEGIELAPLRAPDSCPCGCRTCTPGAVAKSPRDG